MTTRTITFDDEQWKLVPKEMTPAMHAEMSAGSVVAAERWVVVLNLAPEPPAQQPMTDAARDVLAERRRQVEVEGWTPEHDDEHGGELAWAAAACAIAAADALCPKSLGSGRYDRRPPLAWPWSLGWWKPAPPRRMIVKAAALLLAEIERLDRAGLGKGESDANS